jgi:hypothetical protein
MPQSFDERRSGRDRRRLREGAGGARPERADRARARGPERRQFPPPEDPARVTPEERELQHAVDSYKMDRGLARISMAELLGVLTDLGYQRPSAPG